MLPPERRIPGMAADPGDLVTRPDDPPWGERTVLGLRVVIENPAGSYRTWMRPDGSEGRTLMRWDYGFFADYLGADGEELDCYLGPHPDTGPVCIVYQFKVPTFAAFDEEKVMVGWPTPAAALDAYLLQYDNPRFYGTMVVMSAGEFRAWLAGLAVTPAPTLFVPELGAMGAMPAMSEARADAPARRPLMSSLRAAWREFCAVPSADGRPNGQVLRAALGRRAEAIFRRAATPSRALGLRDWRRFDIDSIRRLAPELRGLRRPAWLEEQESERRVRESFGRELRIVEKGEDGKWRLWTLDHSRVLGTHDTAHEAFAQEAAIDHAREERDDMPGMTSGSPGARPPQVGVPRPPRRVETNESFLAAGGREDPYQEPKLG